MGCMTARKIGPNIVDRIADQNSEADNFLGYHPIASVVGMRLVILVGRNHELVQVVTDSFQCWAGTDSMDLCMPEHRGCYIDLDMLFDMEIVVEDIHHSLVGDNLKHGIYY